jgi:hypothetical protein
MLKLAPPKLGTLVEPAAGVMNVGPPIPGMFVPPVPFPSSPLEPLEPLLLPHALTISTSAETPAPRSAD